MAIGKRRHPHAIGTGPGIITEDGCSVDLWAALPAGDTPRLIDDAISSAASVLDLGAGTGRLADPLVSLGHSVVAVDESAAMPAHVRHAHPVCATIEDLGLGTTFDVVLLASHLVDTPDPRSRMALLATCCRHVHAGGQVIVQRYPPGWAETTDGTTTQIADGITRHLRAVPGREDGRYTIEAIFRMGQNRWSQHYTMQELGDDALEHHLRQAGLRLHRWISDDGAWVSAAKELPRT